MYWLGLQVAPDHQAHTLRQGAIIGPIILCCVLTVMQILRATMAGGGGSSATTPKAL